MTLTAHPTNQKILLARLKALVAEDCVGEVSSGDDSESALSGTGSPVSTVELPFDLVSEIEKVQAQPTTPPSAGTKAETKPAPAENKPINSTPVEPKTPRRQTKPRKKKPTAAKVKKPRKPRKSRAKKPKPDKPDAKRKKGPATAKKRAPKKVKVDPAKAVPVKVEDIGNKEKGEKTTTIRNTETKDRHLSTAK